MFASMEMVTIIDLIIPMIFFAALPEQMRFWYNGFSKVIDGFHCFWIIYSDYLSIVSFNCFLVFPLFAQNLRFVQQGLNMPYNMD
jgi:hypothetical protein